MRKDSAWRPRSHHPHSGPLHKHASSSHSQTGKYSLTVPLPLPPRLSRLLRIPCKNKLNRRLVDEYEHHGGVSSLSPSPLHDQRTNASDGLSSDERPNQSDSSYSCSSSSSQAPNDADEIIIPSSPRPKGRTIPIQPLIPPPWSPPSSSSISESSSFSSSFDRDEPTTRGRPPFARTRSYQQLPDCFSKSRDPLLWYSEDSPSLKRELQHHRSYGALASRYSRHATPPPPDTGMLQTKYRGDRESRGSHDDDASLREKKRRDEIWREFFEDGPQWGSSRETSSSSSSGSVWGSSRLPSIPTWKRIDDDEDDEDKEVDELIDDEEESPQPACLFRSDEERGAITDSQRRNEASETRLPSISEWYKVVEEYDEDYDEDEDEDYDEDEDELAYELTRGEISRYERGYSVLPWAQEPQKPPPSKELSPESERKLQMIKYSRSLSKRGLKPVGYVASPLGPDWKKPLAR